MRSKRSKVSTVLVIPDAHVDEEIDFDRFVLASKLIKDTLPDNIVIIGDFLTLNCLSRWDRDKRQKMEGRRYLNEIQNGNIALDCLLYEVECENLRRRNNKKALYKPNIVYVEGNHEDRCTRYLEHDPTFEGHISIPKDLCLEERDITWVPYREYYYIDGVGFTHIPHNKIQPISGVDICRKASQVTVNSIVFGHTHSLNVAAYHKEGQPHLQQILNVGCFISKKEDYVQGRVTDYWRGLVLMDIWKPGRFDFTLYSMGRLERMYQ